MVSHGLYPARSLRWFVRSFVTVAATLAALMAALPVAPAQEFPTRPVKFIVPHPAGGTADAMPRLIGDWLSRKWRQPVVIENRTGAAGNIGAEAAYRSEPDGYTLLAAAPSPLVINQNLYSNMNFDPAKFEPIIVFGEVPNALVVNADFPPNTVAELVSYAKANPDKVISATQGNGSTSHLTSALFQILAGVKVQDVPYRGSSPALNDLISGTANIMFVNLGVSLALVDAGKLKLLAVATGKRLPSLPKVPTLAETLPGFESSGWFALAAPPKTPQQIVNKINADVNEGLRHPEIIERMNKLSAEIVGGTPQDTARYMREEIERWKKVITTANVKL
jgi:tripartite-type tricarboxylate transporter receptor subunit TctC